MADLDRRLRSIDEIPAPDLWSRVGVSSERRPTRPFPSPLRRVAIIAMALCVSILAFTFAFFGLRDDHNDRHQPGGDTVSVSGALRQGTLLCTVTAPAVVDPGDPLGLEFAIENVTDRTREFSTQGAVSYVLTAADGAVYDSETARQALGIIGPIIPRTEIAPGATWRSVADPLIVRWGGPLTLTPTCLDTVFPALTIDIAVPGSTPTVAEAIERAADTNGALLGMCMPLESGQPTLGTIQPPTPFKVPDMSASCSARVILHDGFAVVRMTIVTPPREEGVAGVADPYYRISIPNDGRPIEVIVWDIVVTQDRATVAGGQVQSRTALGDGMAPDWSLNGSGWEEPEATNCGVETSAGGPGYIEFINACPSPAAALGN
jgi:hypothetical protein